MQPRQTSAFNSFIVPGISPSLRFCPKAKLTSKQLRDVLADPGVESAEFCAAVHAQHSSHVPHSVTVVANAAK